MQVTRLIVQGRLAEFFGERVIILDKFMRNMGFYRRAVESIDFLDELEKGMIQAYCDGVNDFVTSVSVFGSNSGASLLPPEIYLFGMTDEVRKPFTIADVLGYGRLISFQLTWNWSHDLSREALRQAHPDFEDLIEELLPFTRSNMYDMVTVLDDEDLKQWGQYSEQTLDEKYQQARDHVRKASPPLHPEIQAAHRKFKQDDLPNEVIQVLYGLSGVEASNNWAVHGNHTTTGKPIFSGDPHLGCKLPAFWQLMEV